MTSPVASSQDYHPRPEGSTDWVYLGRVRAEHLRLPFGWQWVTCTCGNPTKSADHQASCPAMQPWEPPMEDADLIAERFANGGRSNQEIEEHAYRAAARAAQAEKGAR